MSVSEFDVEELIRGIGSLDDDANIDYYIEENFGCSWDSLVSIVNALMPLITLGSSPLTGTIYRGFGKDGRFFIKEVVDNGKG